MFKTRAWQLTVITILAAAGPYAQVSLSPLQEAVRRAMGLSDNEMALLQGPVMALPLVLGALPLGLLIDRYSRIVLLRALVLLGVAGSVGTALSTNLAQLVMARLAVGLAANGLPITAYSLVSDLYTPTARGRAVMSLGIGQVVAASASFAFGGSLLGVFAGHANAWRVATFLLASPVALSAVLAFTLPEPARTEAKMSDPPLRRSFVELWEYRQLVTPIVIFSVLVGVANGAAWVWAVPTFSRTFTLPPDRVGAIMAIVLLLSGVVGFAAGGVVADLCQRTGGPHRTIVVAGWLTLLAAPSGLFPVAPNVLLAVSLLLVLITVGSVISLMSTALCTVVVPNELRGLTLAISSASTGLFGIGFAPLAVSELSGFLGGERMIGAALSTVCVLTSLGAAATFALGSRFFVRTDS